jgi:hypothetical protein
LSYTHVQPQRSQYSTFPAAAATTTTTTTTAAIAAIAAAAFEEEDSVDSEESNDYEQKFEGTKNNQQNQVHVHISKNSTTMLAPAIGEEEQSVDSEEDADNKPTEGTNIGTSIFAQEYGTKTLSVTKTKHFETEENLANSNSDTEGSSETCESETKFRVDIITTLEQKKGNRSNEYIQRKNKYLKNARRLKKETQRKCNECYKIALLELNDLELSYLPVGNNHQVR